MITILMRTVRRQKTVTITILFLQMILAPFFSLVRKYEGYKLKSSESYIFSQTLSSLILNTIECNQVDRLVYNEYSKLSKRCE